ncbi:MAG: RNA polymerase-associated protein RapA, partial [Methylococcales bacterium]|nr:RNA polymerase-associated protein RapA [Methylococcales bacterium]
PEDGTTVTITREMALMREDMAFLSFEHPMLVAAMDLVLSSDTGNASMSVIQHPELKGGQFLLECLFIVECVAPSHLQVGRFLPPTLIRILIDQHQEDLTDEIVHDDLIETGDRLNKEQMGEFLSQQRRVIQALLAKAQQCADIKMQTLINTSHQNMIQSLGYEIKRLVSLKKINSSIKSHEIQQLKEVALSLNEVIQSAQLKLDAVRFIVTK